MRTSLGRPATHAGLWIDQTIRGSVTLSGSGRIVWRPEEEIAMEQAMKRSRIMTIRLLRLDVEIRLHPRLAAGRESKLSRIVAYLALTRTLAREHEAAHTRLMLRG